jgi:hypothetical protein
MIFGMDVERKLDFGGQKELKTFLGTIITIRKPCEIYHTTP